jgi:serine protease Do
LKNKAFCQRNLKPVFVLLVLLVAATIVWAIVDKKEKRSGATNPKQTSAAGQEASGAKSTVDAVSTATASGGMNLVLQPGSPRSPARMQLAGGRVRNSHAFNTISSLILPSVVSIYATRALTGSPTIGTGAGVRFADPFDGVPEKLVRKREYENVGSGFIIDSRGYILTNYHVVSQAADLMVSISGKIMGDYPATIIAVDPAADLALIKTSGAPTVPEARLGDSRSVQVGDWVLAFGSPFGLEQTVTQGIISNRRELLAVDKVSYGEMLQTDAPINRGSSGGPLVNLRAEVIGINSAIYGPNEVFSGTGFAIPVDRAKAFLAQYSSVFNL